MTTLFKKALAIASGGGEVTIEKEGGTPLDEAEELTVLAGISEARARMEAHHAAPSILIDYPEAARLLGISVEALRQRVSSGSIPARCMMRTGRRVQFRTEALITWAGGGR
jgi:excisionase family DNA binding protein